MTSPGRTPLAITGVGLRLPGASSMFELEALLKEGRVLISALPLERLDRELFFRPGLPTPGFTSTELGAVVPLQAAAPELVGQDSELLRNADPAQLLFLQVALEAVAEAGWDRRLLSRRRVGVIVGHSCPTDRAGLFQFAHVVESLTEMIPELGPLAGMSSAKRGGLAAELTRQLRARSPLPRTCTERGLFAHGAARLVADRLDLRGPCWVVDAACASSLAALYLAHRLIAAGRMELAIVGGCAFTQWASQVHFSQAGALSATGSFPFDARADGFVSADGYTAMVVEPLERVRDRGHTPLALLRRISGACDGRGKSLWAPAVKGQTAAIRRCYDKEIPASTIQVVEAHCTGTQVGDATEAQALTEVFGPGAKGRKIPVASIKGNLGHTREAAGLAGLLRLLTALQSGSVTPGAGFENPSPAIDWNSSPLRVPRTVEPWPALPNVPRRGAVSSMGIGGLNYHAVLEEASQLPNQPSPKKGAPPSIAVVGVGFLHPHAHSLDQIPALLASPPSPVPMSNDRWPDGLPETEQGLSRLHHPLTSWRFDWQRHRLPPRQVELADPLHLMLLEAAARALESAGWWPGEFPFKDETAVFLGTIFESDYRVAVSNGLHAAFLARDLRDALIGRGVEPSTAGAASEAALQGWRGRFPTRDEWGSYSSSTFASRLAKHFDLGGPCAAMDAGEDASTAALLASATALAVGDCAAALCCAGQRFINPLMVRVLTEAGWSTDERPLALADTAVALLLRRTEDARRDGQTILAEIEDIEQAFRTNDPWAALADAAGAHSFPNADTELRLVAGPGVMPEREKQSLGLWASSSEFLAVNPALGFAQGASGLLSLLVAVAAARQTSSATSAPFAAYAMGVAGSASIIRGKVVRPAGEDAEPTRPAVSAPITASPRILRMEAADPNALAAVLDAARSDPEAAWRKAAGQAGFSHGITWRLAVVADSPQALAAKLALVQTVPVAVKAWPALHEQGVFLHECPQIPPRVAVLCSGQASQYQGMLRGLVTTSAAARSTLEEINRSLASHGEPAWQALAWEQPLAARLGTDTWLTQAAVLGADMLAWAALSDMGVRPDVTTGHSLGEFAALAATGGWSIGEAVTAVRTRCRILARLGESPGQLLSTSAPECLISEIQRGLEGRGLVAAAVRNSPEQLVVAVSSEVLDEVVARLQQRGEAAQVLAVPMPYHSRLLDPVQQEWDQAASLFKLSPPRSPFLSWVDVAYVGEPAELRRRLAGQNLAFLDFERLVRRLWDDGVRVMAEAGPRSVLTRLVRATLRGEPVLAISVDQPQVRAEEQLLRVRALLETQGVLAGSSGNAPVGVPVSFDRTRTLPAPMGGAVPHFDATTPRRSRRTPSLRENPPAEASQPVATQDAASPVSELDAVLIEFVCDHTGYPRELVGMDQDLEADLGIDSLKKAQMLLEARDRFAITTPVTASGLALGKLTTLRDIARLLAELQAGEPGTEAPTPATAQEHGQPRETPAREAAPPSPPGQIMRRWVVRPMPFAATALTAPPELLPTLVVAPNPLGSALIETLRTAGISAEWHPDIAAARSGIGSGELPRRLILATALAPETGWLAPDAATRRHALERHGTGIFGLLQEWVGVLRRREALVGSELLCLTGLGGGPGGVTGRPTEPAGGGVAGLVRSLWHEILEIRCGLLDFPADETPARVARATVNWLKAPDPPDCGAARGRLFCTELVAADLPERTTGFDRNLNPALDPDAAWLVTGGGRGITALAARALALRFGVFLHLVGRTAPDPVPTRWLTLDEDALARLRAETAANAEGDGIPPEQAWADVEARLELHRTLAVHDSSGVQYAYHQADVTDAAALEAVFLRVRKAGKPVRGILHGAGYEFSTGLERKSPDIVHATLESKVLGLQNLLALTRRDPVSAVVTFGSISSLVGSPGQSDYALANGLMASLLASFREATGIPATTMVWGPWEEAGMASRGTPRIALAAAGVKLLPVEEGCAHLVRELEYGLPEPVVVVFDRPDSLAFPRALEISPHRVLPAVWSPPPAMLDQVLFDSQNRPAGGELLLDPARHALLRDHCPEGVPLVPAVAMIEAMAEAACGGRRPDGPLTVRDLNILAALRVPAGARCPARVTCREADGWRHIRFLADRRNRQGNMSEPDIQAAEARIRFGADVRSPELSNTFPENTDSEWIDIFSVHEADRQPVARFHLGPALHSLQRIRLFAKKGFATLEAPDDSRLWSQRPGVAWCIPAALVDGCFVACGVFCHEVLRILCLPVGFAEFTVARVPVAGTICHLSFELNRHEESRVEMSFQLHDTEGNALLWCRGLTLMPIHEAPEP